MNACLFKKRDFFFVTGAMGCKTEVSGEDPDQYDAIQCCHQSELFDSIDSEDNCSRWLCNGCRIINRLYILDFNIILINVYNPPLFVLLDLKFYVILCDTLFEKPEYQMILCPQK